LKKGDLILSVGFLIIALSLYLVFSFTQNKDKKLIAYVIQNDETLYEIDLSNIETERQIIIGGQYSDTILVAPNKIRFEDASCPDKICVRSGWLTKSGDVAVCLPNKVIIKIKGENNLVDGVTY